jgi:membrane protein
VQTIVENAHHAGAKGGIATIISFSLLAIGASATFSSLNSALNIVWPYSGPRTSGVLALVRVRLISFGLVLGVAFLLIVSLVLDTVIVFIGNWLWGDSPYVVIGNLLQLGVGLLVLMFAFAALLKFLPDASVLWRDALVGGIVAAVLFTAGKKLFALYLAHAGMASSFGAAGSLAVLLMWLYFSAVVLLLGAEFSAARGRLHDPRGGWGMQGDAPPGSRAMLASVLAASTVRADAAPYAHAAAGGDGGSAAALSAETGASAHKRSAHETAVDVTRKVLDAEAQATRFAASALVEARRQATAADRYVRRNPWTSVLLAAAAGLTAATVARRGAGKRQ